MVKLIDTMTTDDETGKPRQFMCSGIVYKDRLLTAAQCCGEHGCRSDLLDGGVPTGETVVDRDRWAGCVYRGYASSGWWHGHLHVAQIHSLIDAPAWRPGECGARDMAIFQMTRDVPTSRLWAFTFQGPFSDSAKAAAYGGHVGNLR